VANELINTINKLNDAIRSDRLNRTALTTVLALEKKRIFEEGKDSNGGQIGTYGTKPISISKKNQARNTGKTYFPGGYSEYKSAIGKNPGYVNLRNTDQMRMDFGILKNGQSWGLGFQNGENFNKSNWMESKYDKDIFQITESETNTLADVLVLGLNQMGVVAAKK
jgi:hypothetical protein